MLSKHSIEPVELLQPLKKNDLYTYSTKTVIVKDLKFLNHSSIKSQTLDT